MKKKGQDLALSTIIGFILVVGALAVLGIIVFNIFKETNTNINHDTCEQSITLRSGVNYGIFSATKSIPLKCKTDKICICKDCTPGDLCEVEFGKSDMDNFVLRRNVVKRDDIYRELGLAHYECFTMTGEGMLNFMPHAGYQKTFGFICSRIVFSKDVKELVKTSGGDLTYMELYSYMLNMKTNDGISYLERLYNIQSNQKLSTFMTQKFFEWKSADGIDDEKFNNFRSMTISEWKIDSSKQYAIVTLISPEGTWNAWTRAAVATVFFGGLILAVPTGGVSILTSMALIASVGGGASAGGMTLVKYNPVDKFTYVAPGLYPYDPQTLNSLGVYDFSFAP